MIYRTPVLEEVDVDALELVNDQRSQLKHHTQSAPRRWDGLIRRVSFAKAIQGSNSIEGIEADLDTAVAAIQQEPPLDEKTETWLAIGGYRAAMTYIMQAAQDPYFEFSKQFLKSLHFMIAGYSMTNQPGQWRSGSVFVVNSKTGETVYDPPMAEVVNELVEELIDYLDHNEDEPTVIRAAMAHLNLTMIHPFKDGNGRVARALQTLVIARDGLLHPVFSSIEEWLGDNTQDYYDILASISDGRWSPERNALGWIRFCIKAHYQQAAKIIDRNEEAGKLYDGIMEIIEGEKLPERTWMPLFDAAYGVRVTNSRYRHDAEITDFTASRDLKRLSESGLLEPHGEKRSRTYSAAKPIMDLRNKVRVRRIARDPYEVIAIRQRRQAQAEGPRLPGL